jgi:predicted small integral membrane protein
LIDRICKAVVVLGVAACYTLLVFNNITDYGSNYQFVRHVLLMDTTFPGNHSMWRAIHSPAAHAAFYLSIIAWEFLTMALCWWGGIRLLKTRRGTMPEFIRARSLAVSGLVLGLMMWLFAFLTIGGEWFLMWQSPTWNGQEAAFRMFTVLGLVLLFLVLPERNSV